MTRNKHNKDKKLHNFEEKLHNSHISTGEHPDLAWQETTDLSPEDEADGGTEIYYFTDEDGDVHSREFLQQELIHDDDKDAGGSLQQESSTVNAQRLDSGTTDIVNLVQAHEETARDVSLSLPRSKTGPIDVRISSEVVPDMITKKAAMQPSGILAEGKHTIVSFEHKLNAQEQARIERERDGEALVRLSFTEKQLHAYVSYRNEGLAKKSKDWINRASQALWESTQGDISHRSMTEFRTFVLGRYSSIDAHRKVLGFAAAFLRYLAQTRVDPRYLSFTLFLERPKTTKVRKAITERIITRADIIALFQRIDTYEEKGKISAQKARNYRAFALLASYTGLRPSTIQRLTAGQFVSAFKEEKPVLHVLAEQEKNRVEHYVPLHPVVISSVKDILTNDFSEKSDDTPLFMFHSFEKWLERQRIPLPRVRDPNRAHLWLSDFRKFAEQYGDIIGWDATNRKYVLAHGMTGVDWGHYKHPLPDEVYDKYMICWRDVEISADIS
ncbi:MAG: tyrosine-type recombinase/integrase [Halobacteriota archaeon]